MATFTANAAQAGVQPKGLTVGLVAVTGFYSFASSTSVGTTIQMVKVPKGATPVLLQVTNSSTGDNTIQVGDGNDPDRYRVEGTLSSGQGTVICTLPLHPYTYSVDDTIDIVISRASATTAGGAVYLTAIFSMDIQAS
jgi:hypothetical protein